MTAQKFIVKIALKKLHKIGRQKTMNTFKREDILTHYKHYVLDEGEEWNDMMTLVEYSLNYEELPQDDFTSQDLRTSSDYMVLVLQNMLGEDEDKKNEINKLTAKVINSLLLAKNKE